MQFLAVLSSVLFAVTAPLAAQVWVAASNGAIPTTLPFVAAVEPGGTLIYVCRTGSSQTNTGWIRPGGLGCYTALGLETSYSVLTDFSGDWNSGQDLGWLNAAASGPVIYVCRAVIDGVPRLGRLLATTNCRIYHQGRMVEIGTSLTDSRFEALRNPWTATSFSTIPPASFQGGNEPNLEPLYVCRAPHLGGVHPGKTRTGFGGCYLAYDATGIGPNFFDVLTNFSGTWIAASGGAIPAGSFVAASEAGSPRYSCRVNFSGGVHPGKIGPGFAGCQFEFGGFGTQLQPNYDVVRTETLPSCG